jgi:hypothetical protein
LKCSACGAKTDALTGLKKLAKQAEGESRLIPAGNGAAE